MIDQVEKQLEDWVGSTLKSVTFSLEAPADGQGGQGISLYLMDISETPSLRGTKRPPLQLSARYLATSWASKPEKAHRLLVDLAFAAMQHPEYEAEIEPLSSGNWTAFGVVPRPSFMLRVPLRLELPEPETKLVLEPLVVKRAPVARIRGVVLGPGDVPVPGARVELPALQLSTRTDRKGRFHFSSVPGGETTNQLRVRAKGREVSIAIEPSTSEEIVIRFEAFD